jgi:glycerol-3-phosphate O-acyltransferase
MAGADDHRLAVQKTAFEVSHRINAVTPITASALVTLPLLGIEDRALTVAEIQSVLHPLLAYVRRRNLPTAFDFELDTSSAIRRALAPLVSSGVVTCFDRGTEPVYAIGADRHLVAAFYRNNAIHFFVERAIAELLAIAAAEQGFSDPVAEGRVESEALRDLLKFEFFFGDREQFRAQLRVELDLIDERWDEGPTDPDRIQELLAVARPRLAHRILQPFLESYLVVAQRLAERDTRKEIDEKEFIEECLAVGRQLRLQQRVASSESISSELFSTALQLARNRDLVDPDGDDLSERRRRFAAEIETWVERVRRVRDLAVRDLDEPD